MFSQKLWYFELYECKYEWMKLIWNVLVYKIYLDRRRDIDWKEIPHYVVINKTTKQIDTQVCKVNANKISTFIFFREVNCQCPDYRREYVIVGYLLQDIQEATFNITSPFNQVLFTSCNTYTNEKILYNTTAIRCYL